MRPIARIIAVSLLALAGTVAAHAAPAKPARSAAPAAATGPVPLLWKVTGPGDARVYLLGSFHLLRAEDYPVAAEVDKAFEASRRVLFELTPEEMESPELAQKLVQAAVRTDGTELRSDLDPATWTALQAYAKTNQLPLAQLQGMKAWFVGLSLSMLQMQKQGLDPKLGLDRHFMQRAQAAGKSTDGLEDVQTQIAVLAGMSQAEQQQMVAEALEQADKGDTESRLLHDAWKRGDDGLLWNKMAVDMKRRYPALYQRINTDRNDAWVPRLVPYLQAGQGGTLVVVGTLHLLGGDGVVEKLRAKGYKVERVRAKR